MWKIIVKFVYYKLLRPLAKKYVESTENTWDDAALKFLDGLVEFILGLITGTLKEMEDEKKTQGIAK